MSATLVHGNTSITLLSGARNSGVNVITPVMAVSVCRPPIGNAMPSRRGSAISRSHLPAQSLPTSHTHFKLHSHESIPAAGSLSSSLLEPYPPVENTTWASESREGLTLPRIRSPTQLCSASNSQSSVITTIDATIDGRDRVSDVDAHLDKPNPPSIFPNFRALQRLAASAKLRINNLKSKEAKAITALLNQEKNNQSSESHSCQDNMMEVNNVLNSSWESHDEYNLQPPQFNNTNIAAHSDKGTSKSKTKKFHRSRSRRRGGKTPSKKKNSPATKKDINSLGDFSLASTITLSSRFERKKVETFSTKFSKNFTSRKAKAKDSSSNGTSSQLSLTTVALEKRNTPSTTSAITKKSKSEASDMPTSRMVLEHAATVYGSGNQVSVRLSNKFRSSESEHSVQKVFLSEKQSSMLKDCGKGVPCAPPASPTPQQLEKFEYVPSLTDLRSQRALKDKLTVIDAEEKKKGQKTREEKARQEKLTVRSNISVMRQRQRQEIYALNKVMTEFEFDQFQKFCDLMQKKDRS